ncbi:hypothetical protein B0I37DRAFT_432719 [Chaetomium sp. MPI-CAGE-AT-0009]|nr:hypothetical protein B0I37DRAFT_432719 [Chaetomium sp. MPI-CAGE-AT-0009]
MVTSPWLTVALGAVSLMPGAVAFNAPVGKAAHAGDKFCPERCAVSGPSTGNWSVYPNFKVIKRCQQTMFYDFSLDDPVDNPHINRRIQACSSFGSDFDNIPSVSVDAKLLESASSVDVKFELGWWHEGFGLAKPAIRSLAMQIREYIDHGHGASDRPFVLYGRSGQATIGVYIGQGLLNQGLSDSALRTFQDNFDALNVTTPGLAMQLCGSNYDSAHIFGVVVTSNATFAPIQNAIKSWTNSKCLSFAGSRNFSGKATFATPLPSLTLTNSTLTNTTVRARRNTRATSLQARTDCRTVQVAQGEGCAELAVKCGISGADFTKYNPGICGSLKPKQHVCCSSGSLPDVRPKPNDDGSCFSYQVQKDDNCDNLAAEYGLTRQEIGDLNQKTWGWSGCEPLFEQTIICLSKRTPPFPAPIPNAVCGPQKLGSKPPTDGSDIANLNPCPLNACCNIWGQCGVTTDFCIDTNTGPPGTAMSGTYGCISNCGVDVVKGTGNGAIKLAYFQGYGMNRPCLYQDALQIDTSKYTHLHFGFGALTPSYEVKVGDMLSSYQFTQFKRVRDAKRILSFGGWDFSTFPDTYYIFREGVKPANRLKMASNIANFIKEHDLDGNLLPSKTVAIAAPASYWYLKQFPIKDISRIVDYIVCMTYDLHGQWDAHNEHSQEDCETGNCLRSQVNLTETRQSLAMITKAGVPGNKIVVGVTSYGRSFQMEQPGCWGPTCKFTGTRLESHATPGRCTGTAGYMADAEINEIISGGSGAKRQSRVVTHFLDATSNSDILVYDNNQWVGYMSESTKRIRSRLYTGWGMAGTTDWASDLQKFNDPQLNILIDILNIETLTTAAPLFNGVVKQLPAFASETTYNNAKDTTLNLIGQATTLAKDMLQSPEPDRWTPQEQNKFTGTMAQVIFDWMNVTEITLRKLFNGEQDSIKVLGSAMANGQLIEGHRVEAPPKDTTASELNANVLKSFYGFSIPALWGRSKTYAFVLDSGDGCDGNPASKYVSDDTAEKTAVCFEGRKYYLVHPDGDARPCECERTTDMGPYQTVCRDNKFSMPTGADALGDPNRFGGVSLEDLVIGSVRTWRKNGKVNGGGAADPVGDGTAREDMLDQGIRAAGFVRLPVCNGDRAFQSWETSSKGSSDNYPCDTPPGKDRCGESTFENRGSDVSPLVSDCLQIIRNIEGDASTEFTHRITEHREILSFGSCRFGIERTGGTGGAVEFKVGGQDVIDVINDAVKKYGRNGKISARGVMSCDGTTAGTHVDVLWGIY